MLRLFLVRHGETLSNIWHTFQGWSDTPLTSQGIRQGKQLGKGLENIPFIKAYSSTSERAYDTACFICDQQPMDIQMCRGLKEMNFGLLETKANTFEGCTTYLERIHYPYRNVEGENLEDVCDRIRHAIDQIVLENQERDGNILCVTHGIAILAAIRMVDENVYDRCMSEEVRMENCSVTIISWDKGTYAIEEINSCEYIKKGARYEKDNQ